MKAPLSLNSAIEKLVVGLAFLPLLFMIYPEFAAAAYVAQSSQGKALVFEIDSKPTQNLLTYDELVEYDAHTNIDALVAPKVKAYLDSKGSPLAQYADEIVKQPQWQRALAISYVESNYGKRCADNNCSGIGGAPSMKSWRRYPTKLDWFKDLSALLEKPTYKQKFTSCNTMNGVYNAGSRTWVNGCNKASNELIALTNEAQNERLAFMNKPTTGSTVTTATAEITLAK
ncbi:MAG TPA: hypothetical protein VHQ41_03515 [Patescibacteria group bacterium]|jgi:hypothetical protein|nr:hypothetical protein [Patescibacteria group bacterium]